MEQIVMNNIAMKRYFYLFAFIAFVWTTSEIFAGQIMHFLERAHDAHLVLALGGIALLLGLGAVSLYLVQGTQISMFTAAIFFGIAAQPFLAPIVANTQLLLVVVTSYVAMILFQGGLETPFVNFKRLFWKIISLSFVGLFLTAAIFSFGVFSLGGILGVHVSVAAALLLGAILASTDPAAIIPITRNLRWLRKNSKDIVVSESAMTDVTGALLTIVFLGTAGSAVSIWEGYVSIISMETIWFIVNQIVVGFAVGIAGFAILKLFSFYKEKCVSLDGADAVVLITTLLLSFVGATAFGGSGYLAAFVAGLFFHVKEHMKDVEHAFAHKIDGIAKPGIFILLGALVNVDAFLEYALLGIVASVFFMFIARPLAVFVSLVVSLVRSSVSVREALFISWVRETGAIPAVLLIMAASSGIQGMESVVPVGTWIILSTLIVQPPLTPFFAKKLGVAE